MKYLTFSLSVLLAGTMLAAEVETEAGRNDADSKEQVSFDGQTLELAFQADNPESHIKEFLPAGEDLESWTKLAAIHEFPELDDRQEYAAALIRGVKERYPQSPSAMTTDAKTGDVIVDFVIWPEDESFVEFNVFRCQKNPAGGLIAEQYAVRDYNDVEGFLRALRPLRLRLVEAMTVAGLEILPQADSAED